MKPILGPKTVEKVSAGKGWATFPEQYREAASSQGGSMRNHFFSKLVFSSQASLRAFFPVADGETLRGAFRGSMGGHVDYIAEVFRNPFYLEDSGKTRCGWGMEHASGRLIGIAGMDQRPVVFSAKSLLGALVLFR